MARNLDNHLLPRGAGGMGEVHRAMERRQGRLVAIRALCSDLSSVAGLGLRIERLAPRLEPPPRAER